MPIPDSFDHTLATAARPVFGSSAVRFIAYLGLCAACLQGGVGHERFMAADSSFEHLGLVGGFLLVAWLDLREKRA
jgi:hypothetical protein